MSEMMKCKWCGYSWESRVDNPKCCPSCKQNLTRDERSSRKSKRPGKLVDFRAQAQEQDPVDKLLCGSGISVEGAKAEGGPVVGMGERKPIELARILLSSFSAMDDEELLAVRKPARELKTDLATQELIRRRVARGEGSRAIAASLGIAKSSVNNYRGG